MRGRDSTSTIETNRDCQQSYLNTSPVPGQVLVHSVKKNQIETNALVVTVK